MPVNEHGEHLRAAGLDARYGKWMRVRGVTEPGRGHAGSGRTVAGDMAGLRALRAQGIRTAVFIRWGSAEWSEGVRLGAGHRLPLDLREAFERSRRLGEAYGDLVGVWEIDNEPDIDFGQDNAETYAAFLKAVYLGLHAGVEEAAKSETGNLKPEVSNRSDWKARKRDWFSGLKSQVSGLSARRAPRVVMAPLALPPGPYFERLWDNGIASYTDGFNYHYYGYAGDFTGVYRQFEDAVTRSKPEMRNGVEKPETGDLKPENQQDDLGWTATHRKLQISSFKSQVSRDALRRLPVFITEYGYGLLDVDARNTVEGRVAQWRWFSDVIRQVRDLRIAAPMAFYWNPYYEANLNEFGLTMTQQAALKSKRSKSEAGNLKPEVSNLDEAKAEKRDVTVTPEFQVSGFKSQVSSSSAQLAFSPSDFGESSPKPWMERIGFKVGDYHASPALAYLWDYAERHPYRPRDWTVRATPASPVVIDFIADHDLAQRKVSGGYFVQGHWDPADWITRPDMRFKPRQSGEGRLILYNFSGRAIRGRLEVAELPGLWHSLMPAGIELAPHERREVSLELAVRSDKLKAFVWRVSFIPEDEGLPRSVWSTRLLPDARSMTESIRGDFVFSEHQVQLRTNALPALRSAKGEPALHKDGRWLATDGVRVEEVDGVWRFHIDWLPAEPLRSASVELPLPPGFVFESESWLMLERRRVARAEIKLEDEVEAGLGASLRNPSTVAASRLRPRAGTMGDAMDVYFRTENGNLYQTWPRLQVTTDWTSYSGRADDFTMAFWGRAALPWRFLENRPASLVFFLRPSSLPAVFEVRKVRISTWAVAP